MREAANYFKSDGFERVMQAMSDVYETYGRSFGAVTLKNPTQAEESALSTFFKRDYYNQALIRIGLADFERQMQKAFPETILGEVLAVYNGKPVKHRNLPNAVKPGTFSGEILRLMTQYEGTPAAPWLKEVSQQTRRAYRSWAERFLTEPKPVIEEFSQIANTLIALDSRQNGLPSLATPNTRQNELTPLEEFSEKHTGSPCALDFSASQGRLFLKALCNFFFAPSPASVEDCILLHLRAGLISCGEISSVTVRGIAGNTEVQALTLENLTRLKDFSTRAGAVFVFEDPQVFSAVCKKIGDLNCAVICPTSGFSAAFIYLLRRLENAKIFYAGIMDYKSLLAADKLYMEFGKNFTPWHYAREDYEKILQAYPKPLYSEKKNIALHNENFASLLSQIKKTGLTASSLPLVETYAEEMKIIVQ